MAVASPKPHLRPRSSSSVSRLVFSGAFHAWLAVCILAATATVLDLVASDEYPPDHLRAGGRNLLAPAAAVANGGVVVPLPAEPGAAAAAAGAEERRGFLSEEELRERLVEGLRARLRERNVDGAEVGEAVSGFREDIDVAIRRSGDGGGGAAAAGAEVAEGAAKLPRRIGEGAAEV